MAIISYNTNSVPMGQNKAICANPNTPTKILDPLGVGVQPQNFDMGSKNPQPYGTQKMPQQVIGLVPVFKCCDSMIPCRAGFTFAHTDGELGYITIRLVLNGVILGTFNFYPDPTNTDATIQAAIQATLPPGYVCAVYSSSNLHRVITIYAPSITAGQDCGDLTYLSSADGIVYDYYNFTDNTYYQNPCDATCECKSYPADYISNPQNFGLPVFADADCVDSYQNDINSFLFNYPLGYDAMYNEEFKLEVFTGGVWVLVSILNTTDYGIPYNNNFFNQGDEFYCTNLNYQGYQLDWQKVFLSQ